ncbi:MAG: aldo/keto reductase [Atopobiaceae bacterium]|nr:aldo/keto reductase [Atopobiaceae bacterium]
MQYRRLGRTELMVSEIGYGCEWIEKKSAEEIRGITDRARAQGMNILDCWMSNPHVRSALGDAIRDDRDRWIIQGHVGSTWQGDQYVRTRDAEACKVAFDDLLERFHTDHIDLGMIHYVDEVADWEHAMGGPYWEFVRELRDSGVIGHVGMSTHNPTTGLLAVESGVVDMIMFSVNPAYDMKPASEDINELFGEYGDDIDGMDADRLAFYRAAERADIGLTVMKTFAGGRLLDPARSPFGVALTPAQCIHYALTRPAVSSVLLGYASEEQVDSAAAYETASPDERDYASVLASAPLHAVSGLCTYCGHCAPCTVGINIAQVNKFYDLAEVQVANGGEVPELVRDHYRALEHTADECLGCGACEGRCPFGVGIVERMERAAELFA